LPLCPTYITGHGRKLWKDQGPKLIANKILTELDIPMFGTLYISWERMQDALDELTNDKLTINGERGHLKKHPAFSIFKSYSDLFRRLAIDFEMSPASRMKLDVKMLRKSDNKKSYLS
jgi:P27 family predicted phage terminase small subunit